MGFKTDSSFLRFLSMGARGVHHTVAQLESLGFKPIELERYCGSNKIWATKVKRLRLSDLMCVKTGLRVEVRAKSDLKIKMSDAPNNPDRAWDAGLQENDLVAFIAMTNSDNSFIPVDKAMFFKVSELRNSQSYSKLGSPKSASEGAERDRTWPATVPNRSGCVLSVTSEKIVVEQSATDEQPARKQTYSLGHKTAYVKPGDVFTAKACFLNGAPASMANPSDYLALKYDPFSALLSSDKIDRYAAAKSFPFREDDSRKAVAALEVLLGQEQDGRIRLEAAGSAATLGSALGQEVIAEYIWNDEIVDYLRMEAVFILTELGGNDFAREILNTVSSHSRFRDSEVRQAAVWGLGKHGLKAYADILPYIADEDENVALHAIAAFGEDTPLPVIKHLVKELLAGDQRRTPAAGEALRIIASPQAVDELLNAYEENQESSNWIVATLGRMPLDLITQQLQGHALMNLLAPMLLYAPNAHWLSSEEASTSITFLLKQNIN